LRFGITLFCQLQLGIKKVIGLDGRRQHQYYQRYHKGTETSGETASAGVYY
jgi:hypothetical protein